MILRLGQTIKCDVSTKWLILPYKVVKKKDCPEQNDNLRIYV